MFKKTIFLIVLILIIVGSFAYFIINNKSVEKKELSNLSATTPEKSNSVSKDNKPTLGKGMGGVPAVQVIIATNGKINESLSAVGNIVAKQTVTVKSRVDGYLESIHFREGQLVKKGQLLFQIDQRQFKIAVEQAKAQKLKNETLLKNAKLDLQRLIDAGNAISKQQVDTQASQVEQLKATLQSDQAQLDSAKLQLDFSRITASFTGRVGLRQIDQGNLVRSGDSQGLVNISQTQPIYGVFSLPGEQINQLRTKWLQGNNIEVTVYGSGKDEVLASGKLAAIDNQMDSSSGSIRLKAEFANQNDNLLPNQLTNFKINLTEQNGVLIPLSAVQRGKNGTYVYIAQYKKSENKSLSNNELTNKNNNNQEIKDSFSNKIFSGNKSNEGKNQIPANAQVFLRKVDLGIQNAEQVMIKQGINANELVVIEGIDRLRDGSTVNIIEK